MREVASAVRRRTRSVGVSARRARICVRSTPYPARGSETSVLPGGAEQTFERVRSWIDGPGFDASDRRLWNTRCKPQRPLRQACALPSVAKESSGVHRAMIAKMLSGTMVRVPRDSRPRRRAARRRPRRRRTRPSRPAPCARPRAGPAGSAARPGSRAARPTASCSRSASGMAGAAAVTTIPSHGAPSGSPWLPSPTRRSTPSTPSAARRSRAASERSAWRSIEVTRAPEAGEDRRLVARARADLQDPVARLDLEQLGHAGDHVRLADRLAGIDRAARGRRTPPRRERRARRPRAARRPSPRARARSRIPRRSSCSATIRARACPIPASPAVSVGRASTEAQSHGAEDTPGLCAIPSCEGDARASRRGVRTRVRRVGLGGGRRGRRGGRRRRPASRWRPGCRSRRGCCSGRATA